MKKTAKLFVNLEPQALAYQVSMEEQWYYILNDFTVESYDGTPHGDNLNVCVDGRGISFNHSKFVQQADANRIVIQPDWAFSEEADEFVKHLVASPHWEYRNGCFRIVPMMEDDKTFYQIKAWLAGGCKIMKTPSFLTEESDGTVWMKDVETGLLIGNHPIFWVASSRNTIDARKGAITMGRTMQMAKKSVSKRIVEGEHLRGLLTSIGWTLKAGSNVGEYHFDYDKGTDQLICVNGQEHERKEYGVGKGLKKIGTLLGEDISVLDSDKIKWFSQQLKSFGTGTLEVVGGDDIAHWYSGRQYSTETGTGSLSGSCMRYSGCRRYIDNLFNGNCSMLILRSNSDRDKILGRALLWFTEEGVKFMDRVYSSEDNYTHFFEWAKENGYMRKRYQGYDYPQKMVSTDDTEHKIRLSVQMGDISDCAGYPYMDTFKYLNRTSRILQNFAPDMNEEGDWILLESTEGNGMNIDTEYSMDYTF